MYFILYLLIIIFSSILSFITSGFEHIFLAEDKNWHFIPLGYYFIAHFVILYIIYKIKFKRISLFKIFFFRRISKINKIFKSFDNKVKFDKIELTSMQKKSIKLIESILKDKLSILNSNILAHIRTAQRGNLLISLNQTENIITLMDTSINLFYEVFIPHKYFEEISSSFDKEQDKRMSSIENKKRSELEDVLSKLIY